MLDVFMDLNCSNNYGNCILFFKLLKEWKSPCLCVPIQGEAFALHILAGWTWGCWQYPLCAPEEVSSVLSPTHIFPPYKCINYSWPNTFVCVGAGHWLFLEATARQVLIRILLTPSLAYPSPWQTRAARISSRSENPELLFMHLGKVENEHVVSQLSLS